MTDFINKIPDKAFKRLNGYSNMGYVSRTQKVKESYIARIITACSILEDCGILTLQERIEASHYFRSRVYENPNFSEIEVIAK